MHINRLVDQVLSAAAVELLNTLAAHAIVAEGSDRQGMFLFPVELDALDDTLILVREIFDAEVVIAGDDEWLSFRILQSFGIKDGQLAYQFSPTFAQAIG